MRKRRKIAIIGTAGVPSRYGGFETLAHNLVLELSHKHEIHVYASKKVYGKGERPKYWNNARVHYIPLSANGISSIFYDIWCMLHGLFVANHFLILGVSGGILIPFIRKLTRIKIAVNIDGLEWKREKWGKWAKRFLHFSERLAVRYSHADITDNEAIKKYTAIYYKTASQLIAYGGDHTKKQSWDKNDLKKYPFLASAYAFKVARIEPENNVEMILKAFAESPKRELVVVGNWKHSSYAQDLLERYRGYSNLHLLAPIYNQVELDRIRGNCHVYIHGHSAGGTNPSLVEAMYLDLPVISFDVSYNRATTNNLAIYFKNSEALKEHLQTVTYQDLKKVGDDLGKLARFKYTWKYIARRYEMVFESFEYVHHKPTILPIELPQIIAEYKGMGYAHLNNRKLFFESFLTDNDGK